MKGVISRMQKDDDRIFHKCGCKYVKRIKFKNRRETTYEWAWDMNITECKYCGGLQGDYRIHKEEFTLLEENNVRFDFDKCTKTLYIATDVGYWKIFRKDDIGQYLLYHRNTYDRNMNQDILKKGPFHRQGDVHASSSLNKLVQYVIEHDKAKKIIAMDYHMLPRKTKKQKKYYKIAQNKANKRNNKERKPSIDDLFRMIEQQDETLKQLSFC